MNPQPPRKSNNRRRRGGQRPPKVLVDITAGGVVFKRTRKGLRMALQMDGFGKWTFAKGHLEPGETIEQAALRETMEEMGLRGLRLKQPLGTIDFWFREKYRKESKGMLTHKFVHYFLMEAPPGETGSIERAEGIKKIAWVDPRNAMRMSGYDDVRPVLEKALVTLGIRRPPPDGNPKPPTPNPNRSYRQQRPQRT